MRITQIALIALACIGLTACGSSNRDISMRLLEKPGQGPDEFSVLPSKPLEAPADYSTLPAPTPGKTSRADRSPKAEGIAALGGNPARLNGTGVPQGDAALVRHAARNGGTSNIREELAAEDETFRKRKSRFTRIRLIKTDRYAQSYKRQTLKPYEVWYKYRGTGISTPAAPPRGE